MTLFALKFIVEKKDKKEGMAVNFPPDIVRLLALVYMGHDGYNFILTCGTFWRKFTPQQRMVLGARRLAGGNLYRPKWTRVLLVQKAWPKPGWVTCEKCWSPLLEKNVARHQKRCSPIVFGKGKFCDTCLVPTSMHRYGCPVSIVKCKYAPSHFTLSLLFSLLSRAGVKGVSRNGRGKSKGCFTAGRGPTPFAAPTSLRTIGGNSRTTTRSPPFRATVATRHGPAPKSFRVAAEKRQTSFRTGVYWIIMTRSDGGVATIPRPRGAGGDW